MPGPAPIVVTGARGYIGGRLVERLVGSGFALIGTSRRTTTKPVGWPERADLVVLDPAGPPERMASVLAGARCVVHLASANENRSAEDPDAAVMETGIGARHVLEAAILAGVRRFVHVSTIRVYGWPLLGCLSETTRARPIHPYAISHRLSEDFVLAAHSLGRIEGVVVRLSNVIGAPAWLNIDRWTLLGNELAQQAVRDGRLLVRTPNEWREFISLPDVAAGLHALVEAPREVLGDGLFNLGGGCFLRAIDIAEHMADSAEALFGRRPDIDLGEALEPAGAPPFEFPLDRIAQTGFAPSGASKLTAELGTFLQMLSSAQASPVGRGGR